MLQKFIDLKNTLLTFAGENNQIAESLASEGKHTVAEYFRGETAAYAYAAKCLEDLIKEELPWEE